MNFIGIKKHLMDLGIVIKVTIISFLFVNYLNALAQTNSEFLQALEGEVEDLTVDKATRANQEDLIKKPQFDAGESGAILELQPGLSIAQFTEVLKNNYIGSHIFYKRLNDGQKQEVYKYYLENPDPAKIRAKIIQVSKN